MKPPVSFYACGAPKNDKGFEYVSLGPEPLPGEPKDYLDRGMEGHRVGVHHFCRLLIGSDDYVTYTQLIPIQPSDSSTTRGAYIAVGFLVGTRIPLNVLENCVAVTFEIMGALRGMMDSDQRLPADFRMKDFRYHPLMEGQLTHHCAPSFLCDIFLQALDGLGPFDRKRSLGISAQDFQTAGRTTELAHFTRDKETGLAAVQALDDQREAVQEVAGKVHAASAEINELIDAWGGIKDDVDERLQGLSERVRKFQSRWQDTLGRAAELHRIARQETPARPQMPARARGSADRPPNHVTKGGVPGTGGQGRQRQQHRRTDGSRTFGDSSMRRRDNIMADVERFFHKHLPMIAGVSIVVILIVVFIVLYNMYADYVYDLMWN